MKLDVRELQQQIANLFLEFPELKDDEVLRADMLEGQTEIKAMFTTILHSIDDAKAFSDGVDLRISQLAERKARFDMRVEFLRALILKVMRWADLRKVELAEATLSQRASQPKLIGDPDVALLPEELVKVTRAPDRTKIREALLRGDFVPECSLSNAEPTLAIHSK
jgi:hypothetical protein